MEVHAPHEPIHSWRDFFIHIATITIGLLIAIGLEQTVELIHHRHLVKEARENIRGEIEKNEKTVDKDLGYLQTDADLMKADVAKARMLRDNPKALEHGEFKSAYSWDSFADSAWTSARDSGALTYMPVEEVQSYDDVYEQQKLVNDEANEIFAKQLELVTPFIMEDEPSKIKPEDLHQLLRDSASAYLRVATLHQILDGLKKEYAQTLKQ
jgi:hypothetical protein